MTTALLAGGEFEETLHVRARRDGRGSDHLGTEQAPQHGLADQPYVLQSEEDAVRWLDLAHTHAVIDTLLPWLADEEARNPGSCPSH